MKTKLGIEPDKVDAHFKKILSDIKQIDLVDKRHKKDRKNTIDCASVAFRMALAAFVVGKFQDSSEKQTHRNRIDSIFGSS